MDKPHKPTVVLFGRTNVGKSTLFNKLTERKQALVSDTAGTTRDPNRAVASWRGRSFALVDTGGIMDLKYLAGARPATGDIEAKVQAKARQELKGADLVLFLTDAREGLTADDRHLTRLLRQALAPGASVIAVANKADNPALRREAHVFNKLGLGEPAMVSAANGSGVGDLLDMVVKKLSCHCEEPAARPEPGRRGDEAIPKIVHKTTGSPRSLRSLAMTDTINIAIIGKPNVGKSSLLNAILKEDRAIVSPVPHTTREPQDTELIYKGRTINLIDTAGISRAGQKSARQAKKRDTLEKSAIAKSLAVLKRAEVAVLVVDAAEGASHQEARLADQVIATKTGLVIVANKADLLPAAGQKELAEGVFARLPFVQWAAFLAVSALTGARVHRVLELAVQVAEARQRELAQSELNTFLKKAIKHRLPQTGLGSAHPRIISLRQVEAGPPVFALRIASRSHLHPAYLKYLENRLREHFGLIGAPVTVYVEKGAKVHGQADRA